jgi:hypothetical protein
VKSFLKDPDLKQDPGIPFSDLCGSTLLVFNGPKIPRRRSTYSILGSSRSKRQHTARVQPAPPLPQQIPSQPCLKSESQIISNGGRDIDAASMVDVRGGSLITENIPRRIGIERTRILPLRITDFGAP